MIVPLPFWRIMAGIGVRKCESWAAGEDGSGGWQDKTGAVCVGGEVRISKLSSASYQITRLAGFSGIGAIWPFPEPPTGQS